MTHSLYQLVLTGLAALLVVSCGGGSSSAPSPPLPPVNTNNAPVASITASKANPNEGETILLDGSGSSDADGDGLTYSWVQLSGPTLSFDNTELAKANVRVPNLSNDSDAMVQLQIFDGEKTAVTTISLNLRDLKLSPIATTTINSEKSYRYDNNPIIFPAIPGISEVRNYLVYQDGEDFIWDWLYGPNEGDLYILRPSKFITRSNDVSFSAMSTSLGLDFAILEQDKVSFFSEDVSTNKTFSVEASLPCSITTQPNKTAGNAVIGQVNGGGIIVDFTKNINFEAIDVGSILQSFGETASFCEATFAYTALDSTFAPSIDLKFLAFDQDTNQIIEYRPILDNETFRNVIDFEEIQRIPLQLNLPAGETVQFVTSMKIDLLAHKGMALVFTNGKTEGIHRLVIVGLSETNSATQETYEWSYGTPTSIGNVNLDNYEGETILITTSDSPYAITFKSGKNDFSEAFLPLSGPEYFDIGVGHKEVVPFVYNNNFRATSIAAHFPEEGVIKVLYERND